MARGRACAAEIEEARHGVYRARAAELEQAPLRALARGGSRATPRRSAFAAGGGGAAGSARTTPTPAMAAEGGKWGLQPSPLTRSGAAAAVRSDRPRRRGRRC